MFFLDDNIDIYHIFIVKYEKILDPLEVCIMSITIDWLLTQELMEGFELLAGDTSLQTPVTGINIMDNPDTTPWISQGALLLSTGYLLTDSHITQNLIQELSERNCAGLGIKMNRYIKELPNEMIQQAKQLHFPIFSIPFSSSMDQIANLVYRKLYEEEMGNTQRLAIIYKEINESVLKRQGLHHLLSIIGEALSANVFLTNDSFELMEFYHHNTSDIQFPFSFSRDSYTLFSDSDILYLKNQYQTTHLPYIPYSIHANEGEMQFEIFAINNRNNLLGYLILLKTDDTPDAYDFIMNLQTILYIALVNHSVMTETERSSRDIFFQNLLSGKYTTEQEIDPLCMQNHFEFQKDRLCLVFHIAEYDNLTIAQRRAYERKVFAILQDVCTPYPIQEIHTVFQTTLLLFLLFDQKDRPNAEIICGEEIAENCYNALDAKEISCTIGISCSASGSTTIYPCYCQAMMALEIGSKLHPKEHCYSFLRDQIYHSIINHYTHQELQQIYDNYLGKLERYDIKNQSDLLNTLITYLDCSRNVSQAAKMMFIHRNTMFYRLEQISDLLEIDLNDCNTIYLLQTSIYIRQILQ